MTSTTMGVHPLVAEAARGVLPAWANVGGARRRHMKRVARLIDSWFRAWGLDGEERSRGRAVAYLHDALKGADADELRRELAGTFREFPGAALHGPAVARRLELAGVDDRELVDAIRHHTLGHPAFATLGRALFMADFLEVGRRSRKKWRARLRLRAAKEPDAVLRIVLRERLWMVLRRQRPIHPDTMAFWNVVVRERRR